MYGRASTQPVLSVTCVAKSLVVDNADCRRVALATADLPRTTVIDAGTHMLRRRNTRTANQYATMSTATYCPQRHTTSICRVCC